MSKFVQYLCFVSRSIESKFTLSPSCLELVAFDACADAYKGQSSNCSRISRVFAPGPSRPLRDQACTHWFSFHLVFVNWDIHPDSVVLFGFIRSSTRGVTERSKFLIKFDNIIANWRLCNNISCPRKVSMRIMTGNMLETQFCRLHPITNKR